MTPTIWVLNGPNLGQLGTREPAIYGSRTHEDLVAACREAGQSLGLSVDVRQTDREDVYLEWLHKATQEPVNGLVLNPGAWTHTSVAIRDAAAALTIPFIEVHLSNPLSREDFRHTSFTAGLAVGIVAGFGFDSYRLALQALRGSTASS